MLMRWRFCLTACLTLAILLPQAQAADSLRDLREDVRTDAPASASPPSSPPPEKKQDKPKKQKEPWEKCEEDEVSDTDAELTLTFFWVAGAIATSPFWGPAVVLERENVGAAYFSAYPYEQTNGYLVFDRELNLEPPPGAYSWATKVRAEYGDDFDSLSRWGGHVLVEHSCRLGIDSETNYWREGLSGGGHDELWTGDLNLVFRFAQSERVQFRSGAGVNWLRDDIGTELGFNFTYGADFYLAKPWVLSTELDAGWLGEAAMIHLRSTIGVQWKQAEIYTGYDYREIGNTQLDGFVAGVRLLF